MKGQDRQRGARKQKHTSAPRPKAFNHYQTTVGMGLMLGLQGPTDVTSVIKVGHRVYTVPHPRHVYAGTVPADEVARRRTKTKAARKADRRRRKIAAH